MKECFGNDLKRYDKAQRAAIHAAVSYHLLLQCCYILWNFIFMFAGIIFVYINTSWLTTYEMLLYLGIFWGLSGLPFFMIKDQVKRKFAGQLPAADMDAPGLPVELFKLAAGFALGSWATHVMLIAAVAKNFDLMYYAKRLQDA